MKWHFESMYLGFSSKKPPCINLDLFNTDSTKNRGKLCSRCDYWIILN